MRPKGSPLPMEHHMIPPGSGVLCAVSGGADSMCLLHLLSRRGDISLAAAHFNHQLRGGESDGDEAFLRQVCARWGIPLTVGRGDVAAHARAHGLSTEEAARDLRYAFLEEAARAGGFSLIATAHNADDNAETVLLNLVRGTGLQGLTGIPPRRGNIVRPLLTATRAQILAYLEEQDIPHREDSSNGDETYTRNRLRSQVMPVLRELNPRFSGAVTAASRSLREDNEYLNAAAAKLLAGADLEKDRAALPADAVAQAPRPIALRALRQLIARLPGGYRNCGRAHLEAVEALCRGEDPSGEVHLPGGLTARRVYGALVITGAPPLPPLEPMALKEGANPVPGTGWTVALKGPPWPGLVVRSRREGDTITLPSGHSRSLKRLLIDRKIPRHERDRLPVAADSDGVIAVAGLGPNLSHARHERVAIFRDMEEKDCADNRDEE